MGLRHALGSNAKGVLERCQIRTLELTSPDEACRVLETLTPDAIVLDCHHAQLNYLSESADRLLEAIAARRGPAPPVDCPHLCRSAGRTPAARSSARARFCFQRTSKPTVNWPLQLADYAVCPTTAVSLVNCPSRALTIQQSSRHTVVTDAQ